MNHTSMQHKLFGGAVMVLAGALTAGAALAQAGPGGRGGHGKHAHAIRAAMATLDLTDAQKQQVKAIFAFHKEDGKALREQAKADHEALSAAASAAKPDPAAVGAAFLKVRGDGEAVKAKMKAVHAEINAVLTPEQRAKLDGWIAAHRQQRANFRGGPPAS